MQIVQTDAAANALEFLHDEPHIETDMTLSPGLASAHEQGLVDFEVSAWNAFFLPKGTPTAIVRKLHDVTIAVLNSPPMRARLKEIGADLVLTDGSSQDALQEFVESEIEKWAVVVKSTGMTAD